MKAQPTRATVADRDRVIETVVAAFAADPAFRFFFPDEERFADHTAEFGRYLFDKRVDLGTVWILGDGDAVAMWEPPGSAHGDEPSTMDLPEDALARIAAADAAVERHLPATPHWYLGVLATHPRAAGRRWGRALMAAGLAEAAAAGLPAYLETWNPSNVGLYERSGWRVAAETHPEGTDGSMPIWVLAHPGAR